jgi:ribonuclease P protein component
MDSDPEWNLLMGEVCYQEEGLKEERDLPFLTKREQNKPIRAVMNEARISYRFPKSERLTSKRDIEELFKNGSSFFDFPLLVKYLNSSESRHQVLISVPKKYQKKAVKRNRLKRKIRESYRLNKHLLESIDSKYIGIIYLSKEDMSFNQLEIKLKAILARLSSTKPGN